MTAMTPKEINWYFWVRFLFSLSATAICLVEVITLLYSFAVSDKWAIKTVNIDEEIMLLPELVLCNSNQINRTLASEIGINDEYLTNLVRNTSLEVQWNSYFKLFKGVFTITDLMYEALITGSQYVRNGLLSLSDVSESTGFDYVQLRNFTASLFELYQRKIGISYTDLLLALAHSCTDSVLICRTGNLLVSCCDDSDQLVTNNGVCVKMASNSYYQTEAGPGNGYRILYELHTDDFNTGILDNDISAGIYLQLRYGENISTQIAAQPNVRAMVSLSKVEDKLIGVESMDLSFLSPPCRVNVVKGKSVYKNMDHCKRHCHQMFAYDICHCMPLQTPNKSIHCQAHQWLRCKLTFDMWQVGKAKPEEIGITKREFDQLYSLWQSCVSACPKACGQTQVVASVTTAQFGAEEHMVKMSNYMRMFQNRQMTPEYMRRNFILLDIYFERFTTQQNVMYTVATLNQLMSLIGGQLGLWIGASVMTLVDIVLQIIPVLFGKKQKKKKKRSKAKY